MTAINGAGTTEQVWRPFLDRLRLPVLELAPPPRRAVVVAPHPDDEVLAVGGLLVQLQAAGAALDLVAVTDGESSHPGGSIAPLELAARRRVETEAALDLLGLDIEVARLGLPDGGRESLEQPVLEALRLSPGDWLLGPWAGDGHPDHEAVGRACAAAAVRDGARLLAYPVWAWHWSHPDDPTVPWERAHVVEFADEAQARKARAVAAFRTQVEPLGPKPEDAPVLPPHVLQRFARPYEVVLA